MKKNIKLLLLDFDGTTLQKDQIHVSKKNMDEIQKAIEIGVIVVPCTGRVLDMFPPQITKMKGIDYSITSHGARLIDVKNKKTLYKNVISPEKSEEVYAIIKNQNIYAEIAANNTIYLEKAIVENLGRLPVPRHHEWYLKEKKYTLIDEVTDFFISNRVEIEKVNIYGLESQKQKIIYEKISDLGFVKHTRVGYNKDLEFSLNTLDKKIAVKKLIKYLNITEDETMIIGDSSSDIEVIRMVGVGVAMDNAPDWIKQEADFVTSSFDKDGVAKAIRKYILGERQNIF